MMEQYLPHVNVALNILAAILLLAGRVLVKQGHERAHRNAMLSAFAVSTLFLISYLTYHYLAGHRPLPDDVPKALRYSYLAILFSHIVLAMTVPFFAIAAIFFGWKGNRHSHRRIVKWGWPIWFYVSVTGVVVYLVLYQIAPRLA